MKTKTFILFFFAVILLGQAQEISSKGDKYFYSYAYKQAISAYQKDMSDGKLVSNHQLLNLADSYFRTGAYDAASKIYVDINKKDSIMSSNRFNMMLQSLSKTSEPERVRAFMNSKKNVLSNELLENAEFNFELLKTNVDTSSKVEVFNSNGNSVQDDSSPSFYKNKLLFSSARPQKSKDIYGPSGESYLDIYVARITQSGRITNPNSFTGIPDSKYHKSTPQYSEELGRIFYILSNSENGRLSFDDNGKNALAIGMVYDDGGFFRFMLRDLSTSFYYPFFDNNSGKLYFAANFEEGYGGTDIYYVYTNNGQIMSEPINLGARINSPGNEIAPFIHDGSLYFSSDVFYGLGGMDVYKSNIQNDDAFSIPVNIGRGINSENDDFGLIIRDDEKKGLLGYFASNRRGGQGGDDVYGFVMKEKPGLKTFAIKGKVVNLTSNQGIEGAQVKLVGKNGEVIKELSTSEEGDFRVEVPYQDQITIQSTKAGHSVFTASYEEPALTEVQKNSFDMGIVAMEDLVEEVEDKTVVAVEKFFFARGKSDLTPSIITELDKVLDAISRFPQMQIRIETHTDSRGSNSANKRTSQKRSEAIKNYLLQKGASSSNIVGAIGYGEEQIVNNCTNGVYCLDFLHEQNLRTLFVVTNYDQLK